MIESKVRTVQYLNTFPEISELFTVLDKKGQGTFASVFTVQEKSDCTDQKDTYALKMLIPTVHIRRIENEIRILRKIGGQCNVIKMHTAWRVNDHVFILMPFINFIPFTEYYLTADEAEIVRYMRDLLSALCYIHRYGIIHRDIKPTNFLMDQSTRCFYLVDFGLAHSEVYGDVDDRWEADCSRLDASKRPEPDSGLTENPHPKSRPRLDSLPSHRSSLSLRFVAQPCAPKPSTKLQSVHGRHSAKPAIGFNSPRNNPGSTSLSLSKSTQNTKRCVCGTRMAVCRICRRLPRATAARRGGTLGFRPPEVMMRHVQQTTAVDVWAAGVIFLSFLSGRYPFIKVDDDLDVLHALTHLLGYGRMQQAARSLNRRLFVDPKPVSLEPGETPTIWLRARCIAIRRNEKKLAGLPPLLSNKNDAATVPVADSNGPNQMINPARSSQSRKHPGKNYALAANHIFPSAAYDLLSRLLEPDPRKRISAGDALRLSYFTGIAATSRKSLSTPGAPKSSNRTSKAGKLNGGLSASNLTSTDFVPRAQFC